MEQERMESGQRERLKVLHAMAEGHFKQVEATERLERGMGPPVERSLSASLILLQEFSQFLHQSACHVTDVAFSASR